MIVTIRVTGYLMGATYPASACTTQQAEKTLRIVDDSGQHIVIVKKQETEKAVLEAADD